MPSGTMPPPDRHEADWTSYNMANSDFWLLLHGLADAIEEEGKDRRTRQAAISVSFRSLPAIAQHELVQDFRFVLGELSAFEPKLETTLCRSEEAIGKRSER